MQRTPSVTSHIQQLAKACLIFCSLTISSHAVAGLILNTANDSFIDKTTGIEWMDFGINNTLSFNQVIAELDSTFKGWRLPTEKEVLELWSNAFHDKGSSFDIVYSSGVYYADYSDQSNQELHFDVMASMGYNRVDFGLSYMGSAVGVGSGYFVNSTGGLSYVYNEGHQNGMSENFVYGRGLTGDNTAPFVNANKAFSTMLVRVSEPSTLTTLALSLLALGFHRLKHGRSFIKLIGKEPTATDGILSFTH